MKEKWLSQDELIHSGHQKLHYERITLDHYCWDFPGIFFNNKKNTDDQESPLNILWIKQ